VPSTIGMRRRRFLITNLLNQIMGLACYQFNFIPVHPTKFEFNSLVSATRSSVIKNTVNSSTNSANRPLDAPTPSNLNIPSKKNLSKYIQTHQTNSRGIFGSI